MTNTTEYKGIETTPAENCCMCGRGFTDPDSIALGIGPVCRRKVNWRTMWAEADTETRVAVVGLVNQVAHAPRDFETVAVMADAIADLGFSKLADRIIARFATIKLSAEEGGWIVRTPYMDSLAFFDFMLISKRAPRRRGRFVPRQFATDLLAFLRKHFSGCVADGPKGAFVL